MSNPQKRKAWGWVNIEHDPTHPAWVVYELMSDVSEDCYCAGWMPETAEVVWQMMRGECIEWGQSDVFGKEHMDALLARVRNAAEGLGWWVDMAGADGEPYGVEPYDVVAIPLDEWPAVLSEFGGRR